MNFIIEENLNFYELLNKNDIIDGEDSNINILDLSFNKCLITYENLDENFIKLPCGHKFNYVPLYKEIINQKKNSSKIFEVNKLEKHQIKCPYCRNISNNLLPFIPLKGVSLINGVNYPYKYCMPSNYNCRWKFLTGKNKGKICNGPAYTLNNLCFCKNHHKITSLNKQKICKNIEEWDDKDDIYLKKYKLNELKELLKKNNLKLSGNKKMLILRLKQNDINI